VITLERRLEGHFSIIGLLAGVFVGLVAIALAELADDRIFDESDPKQLVPVPVLTDISPPPALGTIHSGNHSLTSTGAP
jgi:hypothetical protein